MKLFTIFALFFLLSIFESCSDREAISYYPDDEVLDGSMVIDIPVLKDSTFILCSNVFSSVEYVPLESNSHSAVGMIDKLEFTDHGDMIVYDNRNGIIIRYDSEGHYLNKIGERGHQKNEYVKPMDIAYDPFCNQVIVWDNIRKSLLYYNIDGSFVNKTNSELWHGSLEVLDRNYLGICTSRIIKESPYSFKFFLMDRSGKIKKEFDEYNTVAGFQRSPNCIFSNCEGKLLCHTEYSSNIFEITRDSLIPRYHLSFGNNGIQNEWFEYEEDKFRKTLHKNKNVAYCYNFFETSHYFVTTICREYLYLCIKEKEEFGGKLYAGYNLRDNLSGIKIIDESGGILNISMVVPIAVNAGICYFVVEPSLFVDFTENLKKIKAQLESDSKYTGKGISDDEIRKYEKLSENNNPIIVKCVLK